MKNILITGGAGYIGSHAVKLFASNQFNVTVFDNLSRGYKESIEILQKDYEGIEFIEGDLRNIEDIKKAFNKKYDAVIHFAALCSVNESVEQPDLYFENNVCGTLNLLKEMKEHKVNKIVFSSTCATYGKVEKLPVDESHIQIPNSPYGESKLMAEKEIMWFAKAYDIKYVILRYFNVCGADSNGQIGDSKKPSALLMQNAVRGAMNIEPFYLTYNEVETEDKSPIRDYIDVEDLVKAHMKAYEYLENGSSNIFNLGTGTGSSVLEIVNTVENIFETNLERKKGELRKGEDPAIYADNQKAIKLLEWKPEKSLKESVISLKKWYSNHPKGYKH